MINYLKKFSLAGYIKLAFGLLFIVMGIIEKQPYIAIIGGILFLITLINKGGCADNSCSSTYKYRRPHR